MFGCLATSSARAKWRSFTSAGDSVEKKYLTGSGVVREAIFRQQSARILPGYPPMGPKRRGIQLLGWLAIVAGWALLARILIFARIANIWMLVGDALFAGFAAYLIYVGR